MFRGVSHLSLDAKGRISIPARYRDELVSECSGQLIVTTDPSKCLLIYPQPVWGPIEEKLSGLSSFNHKVRSLQRLLIGNACDVEMDNVGRILVAPSLRRYAGLVNKEVVLVGQGEKFELWDEKQWDMQMESAMALSEDDMPEELDGFSL